jgi:hypothetical protein
MINNMVNWWLIDAKYIIFIQERGIHLNQPVEIILLRRVSQNFPGAQKTAIGSGNQIAMESPKKMSFLWELYFRSCKIC